MVILSIDGIDCYYDSAKVLENIRFKVEEGDFVGILGPNGAGKTTLLRCISRVLKPYRGVVLLNDRDVYSMKSIEAAKQIAVVPQDATVAFNFTALDVVLMGRNPHLKRFQMEGVRDIAIAREAMELTNTWHLANRHVNELSGGERQRVIIARALAQEPKILLLDEATANLDINYQLDIMDLIKTLCIRKKLTVIAALHDLNLAARYSNSIILLKDGKIFAIGRVDDVLTSENIEKVYGVKAMVSRNPAVKSLYIIPLSPMNNLKRRRARIHIICGGGTGTRLMWTLIREGFRVSAGILGKGDSDYETAISLKIPIAIDPPLVPITDRAYKVNLAMINMADIVVLTEIPICNDNLRNIEAAKAALEIGKKVIIVERTPIEERDLSDERVATRLVNEMKRMGALVVKSIDDALFKIKELEVHKDE